MGDKRNTRKSKAQRAPAKSKPRPVLPVATPSRSPSTRKRKPSLKAAASRTGRKGPVHLQLEDEGVSLDDIAEDILADLERTSEKNEAAHYAPSDSSKQVYEDEFEEEIDIGSDGDECDSEEDASEPASVPRIEFKRKKSDNRTRGGMLAILSYKGQ